ncbi:MAG: hypothetical protein V1798_00390 [Pseudomonadota bacterium]
MWAFLTCSQNRSINQSLTFDRSKLLGQSALLAVISQNPDGSADVLYSSGFQDVGGIDFSVDTSNDASAQVVLLLYAENLAGHDPTIIDPAQATADLVHVSPAGIFMSALSQGTTFDPLTADNPSFALIQSFADSVFVAQDLFTPTPTSTPTLTPTPAGTPTPSPTPTLTPTSTPTPTPSWSVCIGKTTTIETCDDYCTSVSKMCTPSCTSPANRLNQAAIAWAMDSTGCPGAEAGGDAPCDGIFDDLPPGPLRWKCCCQ